ncbi:hypothetical protein AVEN_188867-1 [Araneus ventricosus]|uniref:Uncharacterized protein n=1 Tax=Araneus ventricosus TaxID=182803 RepID=A0A4Y2VHB7_ARAVE|nr:hypothetical protein AVEN_188867-1 [Araneus ventricosus]
MSRPRWPSGKVLGRRVPGSRSDSVVYGACCTLTHTQWPNVLPLVWRGSLERGCQLRRRPRHLTVVQNYEERPKIALVLPENRTLI